MNDAHSDAFTRNAVAENCFRIVQRRSAVSMLSVGSEASEGDADLPALHVRHGARM